MAEAKLWHLEHRVHIGVQLFMLVMEKVVDKMVRIVKPRSSTSTSGRIGPVVDMCEIDTCYIS